LEYTSDNAERESVERMINKNQEPQPVADNETKTVSNRSPKRLFFLVPEKVLEDVRTQFSFDPAITKQEFLCCLG